MHDPNHNASPFNSIPPVVVVLVVAIVGIELASQAHGAGLLGSVKMANLRGYLIETFGFSDLLMEWMRRNATYPLDGIWRLVTYPFVHYEAMHAIFAAVLLLAMGKFVAERFAATSVLLIFFLSSIVAALAYSVFFESQGVLIGAYPAIYGLIGAYTWTLLTAYEQAGENRLKAFQLIGLLVGIQLLFNAIGGGGGLEWVADLFGFVTGFCLSVMLSPGRLSELLRRFRQR